MCIKCTVVPHYLTITWVSTHVAGAGRSVEIEAAEFCYGYITLKPHKHPREKSSLLTHQVCLRSSPASTPDHPQIQPIAMSPQRETDSFPIQVLTSVNYPDWLAKKPRRGPTARKAGGKPPRGPIHNRTWVDKDHCTPQKPQVPAHAITKPKSERQQSVDARKPVQYYTWWLDCDKEFLLWGRLRKTFMFYNAFHHLQIFSRLFGSNICFRL